MSEFYEFWEDISRLRYDISQTKNQIALIIENLYKQALDSEIKGRNILKKIENEIELQFKNLYLENSLNNELKSNSVNVNLKKLSNDYKINLLEEMRVNKDKNLDSCYQLFNFIKENRNKYCLKHFDEKKQEWYLIKKEYIQNPNEEKVNKMNKINKEKLEKLEKLEGVIKKTKTIPSQ